MLIITFKYKNLKYTFLNLLYLMILSIILGGSLYLIDIEIGYDNVGMIFFTNGKSINIFILILISFIIILIYTKIAKKYKKDIRFNYEVILYLNNKKINLTGYLDSGNSLKDPYFNKPIIIVNSNIKLPDNNFILVPFKTINSNGLLKCIKANKIYIKDIGYIYDCFIGISPQKFNLKGVDIILNKDLMEGI